VRPRLAVIFTFIVMVPLALLLWMGIDGVRREREVARRRTQELFQGRLEEAASRLKEILQARERELIRATEVLSPNTLALREWVRRTPCVSQVFVLGPDRKTLHPPPDAERTDGERQFLERAEQLWRDAPFWRQRSESPSQPGASGPSRGWYSWFWGNGINLVFWERGESGTVLGFELDRMRFISDVVARVARDPEGQPPVRNRMRLVDSRGETICLWGGYEPLEHEAASASLSLPFPLTTWRLDYFQDAAGLDDASSGLPLARLVSGLSALGVLLGGLAVYFFRESTRDLREAAQRVSCLNQVSHEIKSPLTNIRMYSELLQQRVPAEDESRRSIDIIVSESQRLSRLIANVLTFSRKQQRTLGVRRRPGIIDEAVRSVVAVSSPALAAKGLEVAFSANAPREVAFDPDALQQILGNLLSNVEKYAPESGSVELRSTQEGPRTLIEVADRGPGIPWRHREEVFKPFRRLRNELTEGVSGSGLGLSIARDLARLHGGDVRLLPSERGARFQVTLSTPEHVPCKS
jgi:signal transduction histidine kinase